MAPNVTSRPGSGKRRSVGNLQELKANDGRATLDTMIGSRFVASGEYELLDKLGQGGMGEVWKARQRGPSGFTRTVVIKRILPHLSDDPRFVEMFLSEARLTARLQHPNIVQVLNLGHDASGYFIAIEHVAGQPLSKVIGALDEKKAPPVGLGPFVIRDVCRALSYAWELTGDDGKPLELVHRDVSPANVMVGYNGLSKLLDFGVAKALAHTTELNAGTQTGVLKGKLWYMAPERIAGEPFDHRADLFSAGVMLHEALTGERLFAAGSVGEMVSMMRTPVPPPSELNPDVPPALDQIVLRAIDIDPVRRFTSGREMAAALDAVLFELKWGAGEQAALMRQLFPDGESEDEITAPTMALGATVAELSMPQLDECDSDDERTSSGTITVVARSAPAPLVHDRPVLLDGVPTLIGVTAPPTLVRPRPGASPDEDPTRLDPPRRPGWLVYGIAAAIAVAGAGGLVTLRLALDQKLDPIASTAELVLVRIHSEPSGAEVTVSGERVGVTPFAGRLPRSTTPRTVAVSLPGFATETTNAPLETDFFWSPTLKRVP
jgi:serine/threonine-protein kinase